MYKVSLAARRRRRRMAANGSDEDEVVEDIPLADDVRPPWRIVPGVELQPFYRQPVAAEGSETGGGTSRASLSRPPVHAQQLVEERITTLLWELSSSFECGMLKCVASLLKELKYVLAMTFFALFLSLRGADILIRILLTAPGNTLSSAPQDSEDLPLWPPSSEAVNGDSPSATSAQGGRNHSEPSVPGQDMVNQYKSVVRMCLDILTSLCQTQSGFAMYCVKEFPSLIYLLFDLIESDVGDLAANLLDHIMCLTGPIVRIEDDDAIKDSIKRSVESPYLLGMWCRVLAPLVLEGEVGHPPYAHRDHIMLTPEYLIPMRRVQKTVESNIKFLQNCPGFMKAVISLSTYSDADGGGVLERYVSTGAQLQNPDLANRNNNINIDATAATTTNNNPNDGRPDDDAVGPPRMMDMNYLYFAHYTPLCWHQDNYLLARRTEVDERQHHCGFMKALKLPPSRVKQEEIISETRRDGLCIVGACLTTCYFQKGFVESKKEDLIGNLTHLLRFNFSSLSPGAIFLMEQSPPPTSVDVLLALSLKERNKMKVKETGKHLQQHSSSAGASRDRSHELIGDGSSFPCFSSTCFRFFHHGQASSIGAALTAVLSPSSTLSQTATNRDLCLFFEQEASRAVMGLCDENAFHIGGVEEGNISFVSIQKRELLHCIAEYWNVQNIRDCRLVALPGNSLAMPLTTAKLCVEKVIELLINETEDSIVESAAFSVVERFLRCFSPDWETKLPTRKYGRDVGNIQTEVGKKLLIHLLRDRLYNACIAEDNSPHQDKKGEAGGGKNVVPRSLQPLWRTERMSGALAEVLLYHYPNLMVLSDCVVYGPGSVEMKEHHPEYFPPFTSSEESRRECQRSTIPRDEDDDGGGTTFGGCDEAFSVVLMRRLLTLGFFMPFFLRSLVLSLTPGLRSAVNFTHLSARQAASSSSSDSTPPKQFNKESDDGDSPATECSVWQLFVFFMRARRLTRQAVIDICDGKEGKETVVLATLAKLQQFIILEDSSAGDGSAAAEQQTAVDFFDRDDKRILAGTMKKIVSLGPPTAFAVPLFGDAINETEGLERLKPLIDTVFYAPHQLLYSLVYPLQAEAVNCSYRMCIITTALVICMREWQVGDTNGIRTLLENVQQLIASSCAVAACSSCPVSPLIRQLGAHIPCTPAASFVCSCQPQPDELLSFGGSRFGSTTTEKVPTHSRTHCASQRLFGTCNPSNAALAYFHKHGHYSVVQKYTETVHFSTEVAFIDYKMIACHLLNILPTFFSNERVSTE